MRVLSTIDLEKGYLQILTVANSIEMTRFVTEYGHYDFNHMPFGMKNSGKTLQRVIDAIIEPLKVEGTHVMCY